jgi:hypothetical protein
VARQQASPDFTFGPQERNWPRCLKEIDAHVPEGLEVHIVMDNYATHKTPKIKAWLPSALSCPLHANFGVMDQSVER